MAITVKGSLMIEVGAGELIDKITILAPNGVDRGVAL